MALPAYPEDHPSWCQCKRCQAADRAQERAALAGEPPPSEPIPSPDPGPDSDGPTYDDDPYDWMRDRQEDRDRDWEYYEERHR